MGAKGTGSISDKSKGKMSVIQPTFGKEKLMSGIRKLKGPHQGSDNAKPLNEGTSCSTTKKSGLGRA